MKVTTIVSAPMLARPAARRCSIPAKPAMSARPPYIASWTACVPRRRDLWMSALAMLVATSRHRSSQCAAVPNTRSSEPASRLASRPASASRRRRSSTRAMSCSRSSAALRRPRKYSGTAATRAMATRGHHTAAKAAADTTSRTHHANCWWRRQARVDAALAPPRRARSSRVVGACRSASGRAAAWVPSSRPSRRSISSRQRCSRFAQEAPSRWWKDEAKA